MVARFALFTGEFASVLHTASATPHAPTAFGSGVALFGALIAVYGGYRCVATDRALASNRIAALPPLIALATAAVVTIVGIGVGISLIAFR